MDNTELQARLADIRFDVCTLWIDLSATQENVDSINAILQAIDAMRSR